MGLYDDLGQFEFVRQESGYAQPSVNSGGDLEWPLVDLAPNQSLNAVIIARTPPECITKTYYNELLFRFRSGGETYVVQPLPKVRAEVQVNCGTNKIEYSQKIESNQDSGQPVVSLQDRVVYTLIIRNNNTIDPITNVSAISILPQGFTYVAMDGSSDVLTTPQQELRSDGRVKLTWTIPSIAARATTEIVFVGRSGDIVGTFENWFYATAPNLLEAVCKGTCTPPREDEGEVRIYAAPLLSVEPLHTMEPRITNDECAVAGNKVTYQLSLVNTNNHSYTDTTIVLTLPVGLEYERSLNDTPPPSTYFDKQYRQIVTWKGITVPAKPEDQSSALVVLEIELEVGQVFGDLPTQVSASSPDGAIPRKEGALDPVVVICVTEPGIAKTVIPKIAEVGGLLTYQISLVNPNDAPITVTFEDPLPASVVYESTVTGPEPAVDTTTNRLTWTDITIPATTTDDEGRTTLGLVTIQFSVRVLAGVPGDLIINEVREEHVSSSEPLNLDRARIEVTVARHIHLPAIGRRVVQ